MQTGLLGSYVCARTGAAIKTVAVIKTAQTGARIIMSPDTTWPNQPR